MPLLPLPLSHKLPVLSVNGAPALPARRTPDRALRAALGLCALLLLTSCQATRPPAANDARVPAQNTAATFDSESVDPSSIDSRVTQQGATERARITGFPLAHDNLKSVPKIVIDDRPWLESIHPLYIHARSLVEQELNADLRDIRLLLVADTPINSEVNHETRRLVNEQFGTSEFADQFLGRVMKTQSGTYAALFTSRLKAVMVSRSMLANYEQSLPANPEIRTAALLTLLIHELVHAADDQRYHIHENRALNFRASFAQSATFEGHAQWVTRRICAYSHCSIGLDALDNFMFSPAEQSNHLTQPVEAISRNVLEYSYVEGERFIASLAKRPGGSKLIDDLLSSPPFDPIQILSPDNYPDLKREHLNQRLIRASLDIDHPWVRDQWIGVETSPLKGVNLRADPARRQAAVDGFTRLIESMVAMQLYNRASPDAGPVEVTLLQAESATTASLFARTLHQNTLTADTYTDEEPLRIDTGAGNSQSGMSMHMYRTSQDNDTSFRTAIGVSGIYVVQIAGVSPNSVLLDDYAIRVLLNLQLPL
ncbi:hypothetical protein [Granulosicoccus antarcticus]|uniref:Uncharacterized protein n=1 Tax=Granulosicoccus antarcticus IMCC3135 TaxID=1192854 RepID=A0A2Z2NYY0_9GAMM|nr:hypothetical protein [Granulosicoccus antarcticus]ASJ76503.1 hypothetical protein IMCC3135_32290 [Granulosicoccus antarcticus IMCC3135]